MTKTTKHDRQPWHTPHLKRLGTMRDIAGPRNSAAQSPVQLRS